MNLFKKQQNQSDMSESKQRPSNQSIQPVKIPPPPSIYKQPWTSLESIEKTPLSGFCHLNHLIINFKANSMNGAALRIKETANFKQDNLQLRNLITFWFPISPKMDRFLDFRFTDIDSRIHYDHGIKNIRDYRVNFYGSFGFLRNFNKYNLKLGAAVLRKDMIIDSRIKVQNTKEVFLYNKIMGRINENIRFGFVGVLDVNKLKIVKKDLLLRYQDKSVDMSFKARHLFDHKTINHYDSRGWFKKYQFILSQINDLEKKSQGTISRFDYQKKQFNVAYFIQRKMAKDQLFKSTFDFGLNMALLMKFQISQQLSLSLGMETCFQRLLQKLIPNIEKKKYSNSYGIRLDWNI